MIQKDQQSKQTANRSTKAVIYKDQYNRQLGNWQLKRARKHISRQLQAPATTLQRS